MKNLKSYVRAILGEEDLNEFNDFEKGVIFMEKSRLDQPLPPRGDFVVALEYAKAGLEGLKEYSTECPSVIKNVAKLSIELLEFQLEILDKFPEEKNWTYRKSMEFTRSDEGLCDKMDFLTGKLYQMMPVYTEVCNKEMVKNAEREMRSKEFLDGLKDINEEEDTVN